LRAVLRALALLCAFSLMTTSTSISPVEWSWSAAMPVALVKLLDMSP
jgi:hypothetical protein